MDKYERVLLLHNKIMGCKSTWTGLTCKPVKITKNIVDIALTKRGIAAHYLRDKPINKWDKTDRSNFRNICNKY